MTDDDTEQIKQLKYRYLRTLDLNQWDEFTECFRTRGDRRLRRTGLRGPRRPEPLRVLPL